MGKQQFRDEARKLVVLICYSLVVVLSAPLVAEAYGESLTSSIRVSRFANSNQVNQLAPQPLVSKILQAAVQDNTRLLWSSYPASVRGRVFGNDSSGAFGTSGGGWM